MQHLEYGLSIASHSSSSLGGDDSDGVPVPGCVWLAITKAGTNGKTTTTENGLLSHWTNIVNVITKGM